MSIYKLLDEKNKEYKQQLALKMRCKAKAKRKGRNYVFTDLSNITSKFNNDQNIMLAKILSMSESDLIILIIKNIDKINLGE